MLSYHVYRRWPLFQSTSSPDIMANAWSFAYPSWNSSSSKFYALGGVLWRPFFSSTYSGLLDFRFMGRIEAVLKGLRPIPCCCGGRATQRLPCPGLPEKKEKGKLCDRSIITTIHSTKPPKSINFGGFHLH